MAIERLIASDMQNPIGGKVSDDHDFFSSTKAISINRYRIMLVINPGDILNPDLRVTCNLFRKTAEGFGHSVGFSWNGGPLSVNPIVEGDLKHLGRKGRLRLKVRSNLPFKYKIICEAL